MTSDFKQPENMGGQEYNDFQPNEGNNINYEESNHNINVANDYSAKGSNDE